MIDSTDVPRDPTKEPDLGYDPDAAPPSGATADPVPPDVDINIPGTIANPVETPAPATPAEGETPQ